MMADKQSMSIGFVGLGAMGIPMSKHLLDAGWTVYGVDPSAPARERFKRNGGRVVETPSALALQVPVIVTSLPAPATVIEVLTGPNGLAAANRRGVAVVETSTLAPADKENARRVAAAAGIELFDCPVSGTSAQARTKDLVAYLSGPDSAQKTAILCVLQDMTRQTFDVGGFGAGTKMKLVANLLVAVHNMAAAEALLLAKRVGLDLNVVLDAVSGGAGASRMFEVRGPLMARADFTSDVTARVELFAKDLRAIDALARSVASPTPLLSATDVYYQAALAQGRGEEDTACVFDVLWQMSQPAEAR